MRSQTKQSGFSAVELLITLFIASAFLISGYQLYTFVVKDGGSSRATANASREADNYVSQYKPSATDPCTVQTPKNDQSITISGLSSVTLTVTITCPYGTSSPTSKVTAIIKYGSTTPKREITSSTFVKPVCPTGFIPVPGSKTYGTDDFCVMKYEAKRDYGIASPLTPRSTASSLPWTDDGTGTGINQEEAAEYSKNVVGCNGCHLITEAEWLTIAENIMGNELNWRANSLGTYFLFTGHSKNNPGYGLAATTDDNGFYVDYDGDGIMGENVDICPPDGTTDCSYGSRQRRTFYLSNGEVIWDFAGNVWEWTAGQITGGQPGSSGEAWREWNALSTTGSFVYNPYPSNTVVSGASGWNSGYGIGKVFSNTSDTNLRAFARGGGSNDDGTTGRIAGIYSLILNISPSETNGLGQAFGFRVAK